MTVYEVLKAENAKTIKMLQKLEDATAGHPEAREELLAQVTRQLQAWIHASERSLYPVLEGEGQTQEAALSGREELKEVEGTLRLLARVPLTETRFQHLVETLGAQVRQHVLHEEREILPRAARVLSSEAAERLAEQLRREKSEYEAQVAGWKTRSAF